MARSRSARITAGLGANGVTQASQLLMRLAEVPVLLLLWGAAGYGEWLLIAALPAALSFSDGGFTRTARREMAMRAGKGDAEGVVAVFQSAWLLLLVLTVALLVLLVLVLPQLSLAHWLNLHTLDDAQAAAVLLCLAAQVLLYFQCGLLHGAYTSLGRYATGELLINLSLVLCFVGVLGGAALDGGIQGAALGSLLGQVTGLLLMLAAYTWQRPAHAPVYGFGKASLREIKAQLLPSLSNLAFPLAEALNAQGSRILVGLALGPTALAVFATTRTLCRVATQPVLSIARTIESELSIAFGSDSPELARRLFLQACRAGLWLSLAVTAAVACLGPFAYDLWAGKLVLDYSALLILSATSVVNVLWGIALTVPCSINRHMALTPLFVAGYGLASVAAIYLFTRLGLGMPGAALGLLVGDVMAALTVIPVALRIAQVQGRNWLAAMAVPSLGGMFSTLAQHKGRA